MDVERSWHETGAALSKLLLAVLTIAAALVGGILAVGPPPLDQIALAQERLDRLTALRIFVDFAVPTDDHVPRRGDTLATMSRDEAILLFTEASDVLGKLEVILAGMGPLADQANAGGDPNGWFVQACGAGVLANLLDTEQIQSFGQTFIKATDNLYAIKVELAEQGIRGNAAKDLTMGQLALLDTLLRGRYLTVRNLAGAVGDSTVVAPWHCRGGVPQVETASEWDVEDRDGSMTWALNSPDTEIFLVSKSHPRDLPSFKARFERDRHTLIADYVTQPPTKVVNLLPPLAVKLGVALFPGMVSIALLVAMAQVWILTNNMALPGAKLPAARWQQRVSGYSLFPLPPRAGGTVVEGLVSTLCWLSLPVFCVVIKTLAIDQYSNARFEVPIYAADRLSRSVYLNDVIEEVLGYVPAVFQYQALSVYLLYAAIVCTVALLVLNAVARRRANGLIEQAELAERAAPQ